MKIKSILYLFILLLANYMSAQNSLVGDGFGGRLWYKPTNYTVGSYSGYSVCYEGPCNTGVNQLNGWGSNNTMQLGYPSSLVGSNVPIGIPGMTNVKYYSCGYSMGAIKKDNSGWVWGQYWPSGPVKVIDDAYFLDASGDNISFVKTDGTVWSVGSNREGAFGDGTMGSSYDIPKQMLGITNAVRVANNPYVTVVLLADGTVKVAGSNRLLGLLGVGSADFSLKALSPVDVVGLTNIVDIKATDLEILALDNKGDIYKWGYAYGYISVNAPKKLSGYKDIVAISGCDDGHDFFVLDKDKNCFSISGAYTYYTLPFEGIPDVVDIMAGELFGYLVKSDGTLWCIGSSLISSSSVSVWLDLPDYKRSTLTQIHPELVPGSCFIDAGSPKIAISPFSPTICIGSTYTLSVFNDGASSYTWSTGSHSSSIAVAPSATTIYTITSTNGTCTAVGSNTVYIMGDLSTNSPTICSGQTATLVVDGADTYSWSTGEKTNTILVSPIALTEYTVTGSIAGCKKTTVINVAVLPKPIINLGNDTTICLNSNLKLSVANTYTNYMWNNGSTSFSTTVHSKGNYWIKVGNECGFTTDTIQINHIDKPEFTLGNDTILCDINSFDLKINSNSSISNYLWSNAATNSSITISNTGKYWANVINQCGINSDTINIYMKNKPMIDLGNDTVWCDDKILALSVNTIYTDYLWQNGNTTSSLIPSEAGLYYLTVTNECGSSSDSITIEFRDCRFIIPNVITTNGDGINDVFKIKNLQLGVADLKILNRWGNPVYESPGYNNDWSPKEINDGTYYYIMNYPPDNKTYTGFITVISGN